MELEFTIALGMTLIALLATFLILLKGTPNFIHRSIGLGCFVVLLFTITYGYLGLMGKPKPLNYENWYMEEVEENEEGKKGDGEGEGEEGESEGEGEADGETGQQAGQSGGGGQAGGFLEMDVLEWESDPGAGEAYLWLRKDKEPGEEGSEPAMNYSFDTTTEAGKELLKQLQEADAQAMQRGLQRGSRAGTGVRMRVIIDRLLMAPTERFEFFVPPPKLLPPKYVPEPGLIFPNTSGPNPNARSPLSGNRPARPHGPGTYQGPVGQGNE